MATSQDHRSVEVSLLGQKIALKTVGDPALIEEVIQVVSTRIQAAEKRVKNGVPHHVALLALLELAEELVQARQRVADHQKRFEEKARELQGLIQAEFK